MQSDIGKNRGSWRLVRHREAPLASPMAIAEIYRGVHAPVEPTPRAGAGRRARRRPQQHVAAQRVGFDRTQATQCAARPPARAGASGRTGRVPAVPRSSRGRLACRADRAQRALGAGAPPARAAPTPAAPQRGSLAVHAPRMSRGFQRERKVDTKVFIVNTCPKAR